MKTTTLIWTVQSKEGGNCSNWSDVNMAISHREWLQRNWGEVLPKGDAYFVRSITKAEVSEEGWKHAIDSLDRHWYHPGHSDLNSDGWDTCSCVEIR